MRRTHICFLALTLLILIPGGLLALMLGVAAIGYGLDEGFDYTYLVSVPLLAVPPLIAGWGIWLFKRLFFDRVFDECRFSLRLFYACGAAYCGLWLVTSLGRDGDMMFPLAFRVLGSVILFSPVLTLVLTRRQSS